MTTAAPAPVATAAELDAVVALVAAQQGDPRHCIVYVGFTANGIRDELDALEPPWVDTVRVVRDHAALTGKAGLVGVSIVEWDLDVRRAWVLGPWVDGDDAAWADHAPALLDAAMAQVPGHITDIEVAGHVDNVRLADLATSRAMHAGVVNHALTVRSPVPEPVTREGGPQVRVAITDDLDAIAELHDAEFPATHTTARQLVTSAGDADKVVLVATAGDDIVGYAAGQVHPDGEGYLDYVAVQASDRGRGVGRLLVATVTNRLLAASRTGQVSLTVEHHRDRARGLYESLGFASDGSFVGFRTDR